MDLERALETQRVKLLRLVTGWMAVLGFLSAGPLALPLPRWVRGFFEDLLIRAELAAHYMLRASVRIQFQHAWIGTDARRGPAPHGRSSDVPSVTDLLRRMNTLCDVLQNLSRHARRLLRISKATDGVFDFSRPCLALEQDKSNRIDIEWQRPRIERPPDKGWFESGALRSPSPCLASGRRSGLVFFLRRALTRAFTTVFAVFVFEGIQVRIKHDPVFAR